METARPAAVRRACQVVTFVARMADPMTDAPLPPAPAARNPLLVTGIVAFAFFMEMLDATIIVTALPMMAESFDASPVELSLGLTSYMLALAVFIPASGWIADRFGTRTVFCAAIGVFTLASLLCGATSSLWQFVALRFIQGAGGALMSPVGRLVALHSVQKKDLVRVTNLLTTPALIGPVLGPPIGGFITTYGSWRWIFFVNVPIGIVGMILVYLFIEERRGTEPRPFDRTGFMLNGSALACLIYGLDCVSGHGPGTQAGAVLVLIGLGLGWLAVRHARHHPNALVDLSALKIKTFSVPNIGGSLVRIGIAAPSFLVPLLFQVGLGMSAFLSGLFVLAHTAGDLLIKVVTTRMLRRLGFRTMLIWSAVAFAAFIAACALFTAATPYWVIVTVLFAGGLVRSLQMTSQMALQFADIPRAGFTAASTLGGVIQQVVRSFGVAIAAIALNAATALRGGSGNEVALADFQVAFVAIALLSLGSVFWYLPLARSTAPEVSGQRS